MPKELLSWIDESSMLGMVNELNDIELTVSE